MVPMIVRTGKLKHLEIGGNLLHDLLEFNPYYGGRQVLITGKMGTGKTTLLSKLGENDLAKGAYVIWRGRTADGFHYFKDWESRVRILHHKNDQIRVFISKFGHNKSLEVTERLEMVSYSSVSDLIRKVKKEVINVVFEPTFFTISKDFMVYLYSKARIKLSEADRKGAQFGTLMWFEFHQQLLERLDSEWWTVLYDEIDDLFPSNSSGILWHLIRWAQLTFKDFRKSLISMFGTAHNYSDIDHRIFEKIPTKIYLAGAKVPKNSLLYKNAIQSIERGQAKIEWDNKYGEISKLSPYPVPKERLIVRKVWTAEIPDIGYALVDFVAELTKTIEDYGKQKAYDLLEKWRREGMVDRNKYYYLKGLIKNAPDI